MVNYDLQSQRLLSSLDSDLYYYCNDSVVSLVDVAHICHLKVKRNQMEITQLESKPVRSAIHFRDYSRYLYTCILMLIIMGMLKYKFKTD